MLKLLSMFVLYIFVGIYVLKARVLFEMLKIRYKKKSNRSKTRNVDIFILPFFLFYINAIRRIGKDMHAIRIRNTSMQVEKRNNIHSGSNFC